MTAIGKEPWSEATGSSQLRTDRRPNPAGKAKGMTGAIWQPFYTLLMQRSSSRTFCGARLRLPRLRLRCPRYAHPWYGTSCAGLTTVAVEDHHARLDREQFATDLDELVASAEHGDPRRSSHERRGE
jgi:hypothetical protein